MIYPRLLQNLIDYLKKLPGIGEKSAERMALALIKMSTEEISDLSNSLVLAKNGLKKCAICGSLTEDNICYVCANENRDKNTICVLEDFKGVFAFEKSGKYNGTYHVLDG